SLFSVPILDLNLDWTHNNVEAVCNPSHCEEILYALPLCLVLDARRLQQRSCQSNQRCITGSINSYDSRVRFRDRSGGVRQQINERDTALGAFRKALTIFRLTFRTEHSVLLRESACIIRPSIFLSFLDCLMNRSDNVSSAW